MFPWLKLFQISLLNFRMQAVYTYYIIHQHFVEVYFMCFSIFFVRMQLSATPER